MKKLDWTEVQTVIEVAKCGSLSGAARALGVNHSTILRRVQAFETHQQVQIFNRLGNRYQLSSHGKVLLFDLEQVHQNMKALQRRIAEYDKSLKGALAVTTTENIFRSFLQEPLLEFAHIHSGIQLNLLIGSQIINTAELEAEVAVRPTDTIPAGHFGRPLFELSFNFYASLDYIKLNSLERVLPDSDWIGFGSPLNKARVAQHVESFMVKPPSLVASSFDAIASAAASGLGVAFLPDFVALGLPQLKQVAGDVSFNTPVFALAPDESALSSRVNRLMDFLVEYFAQARL